jgi:hypothetical protein
LVISFLNYNNFAKNLKSKTMEKSKTVKPITRQQIEQEIIKADFLKEYLLVQLKIKERDRKSYSKRAKKKSDLLKKLLAFYP